MEQANDDNGIRDGETMTRAAVFIGTMVGRDHDVAAVLRRNGFAITGADTVRAAFDAGRGQRFDLAVISYVVAATPVLPDLIRSIRETLQCPVVCVGAHGLDQQVVDSLIANAAQDGDKPPLPAPDRKQ